MHSEKATLEFQLNPVCNLRFRPMRGRPEASGARLWVHGPDGVPRSYPLLESTVIGCGDHCDIRLDHTTISTDHAEIKRHGATYLLHDLGSSNGTAVNGQVVVGPTRLRDGDVLKIGPFRLEAVVLSFRSTQREKALSVDLSEEQLAVARALVANYREGESFAARPATRRELSEELHLSERTIKRRLDELATKLKVSTVSNHERPRLIADRIIALGLDRQ